MPHASVHARRRLARVAAVLAALCVLGGVVVPSTPATAATTADEAGCTVSDAELVWGFKESFRAYIDGAIAQVWTGTSRTPNVYAGQVAERTFETAYLEYGIAQDLTRGTDRRMWFLHDPIEDHPDRTWEDYLANYQRTHSVAGFAKDITGTYATDPSYGQKLMSIIKQYKL